MSHHQGLSNSASQMLDRPIIDKKNTNVNNRPIQHLRSTIRKPLMMAYGEPKHM
jgi:hypothetical protein